MSARLEALKKRVDNSLLSQVERDGVIYLYLEWATISDLLDERVGMENWEWQIVSQGSMTNHYQMIGRLTIYLEDGRAISRDAGGHCLVDSKNDPSSTAEAMAMRRAVAKFGLGRYLWQEPGKLPDIAPKLAAGQAMMLQNLQNLN